MSYFTLRRFKWSSLDSMRSKYGTSDQVGVYLSLITRGNVRTPHAQVIQPTALPAVIIYSHNQMRASEEADGLVLFCLAVTGESPIQIPALTERRMQASPPHRGIGVAGGKLGAPRLKKPWRDSSKSEVPTITRESTTFPQRGWSKRCFLIAKIFSW